MDKETLLVLAPHPDDETLGCGGLIAKTIAEGGDVFIIVFAKNYGSNIDYEESEKAFKILGVSQKHCSISLVNNRPLELDRNGLKPFITIIEEGCEKVKPTTVAVPLKSYHQDHQMINKAAMAALRPHGYLAKKVLFYEQPYYCSWSTEVFKPNYYVDITQYMDKKIEALKCYKSQKIPFDMIVSMAKIRGGESGVKLAEAYILMREIV